MADETLHPEGTPHVEEDAQDPEAQPQKKDRKPLFIGLGIAVAVVIIAVVLVLVNGAEDAAAKEGIEASMAESALITERVIPSAWGDQSGFTAVAVQVDELKRGFFASDATAAVTVDAENGAYGLSDGFTVHCKKEDGAWVVDQADLAKESYAPIAKIPDEALLAHLPDIMAKADESKGTFTFANPLSVAGFFGVDTEATIVSNEFDRGEEDAQIALVRMVDGVAHEGKLDVVLGWDAKAEHPDWTIVDVMTLEDTEGAMGSIVREGPSSVLTEDMAADFYDTDIEEGSYWTKFSSTIACKDDSPYGFIAFSNVPANTGDMRFSVISNETGDTLYESPRIAPGMTLDYITLAEPLPTGEHSVTVRYTAFGDGWRYMDTTDSDEDCIIRVY